MSTPTTESKRLEEVLLDFWNRAKLDYQMNPVGEELEVRPITILCQESFDIATSAILDLFVVMANEAVDKPALLNKLKEMRQILEVGK